MARSSERPRHFDQGGNATLETDLTTFEGAYSSGKSRDLRKTIPQVLKGTLIPEALWHNWGRASQIRALAQVANAL